MLLQSWSRNLERRPSLRLSGVSRNPIAPTSTLLGLATLLTLHLHTPSLPVRLTFATVESNSFSESL
jgi:hypothetical protein